VVHVGVSDRREEAKALIEKLPGVNQVDYESANGQQHLRVTLEPNRGDPATIAQALINQGFRLTRLEDEKVNLETAFMRLTKGLVQ